MSRFLLPALLTCSLVAAPRESHPPTDQRHFHPPDVALEDPPRLENPDSFSLIVLGDPQSYTKFDLNQPIFELMTAWAAAQKDQLRVKTVLCTGDLVEQNDLLTTHGGTLYEGGRNGNQTSQQQWANVSRAFCRLDAVYPYILATGNHDYGYENAENRQSRFSQYFTPARNALWNETLVATTSNALGTASLENAAYQFHDPNWGSLLIVSLEFAPRDEVLDWASRLISSDRFEHHRVILLTHSFLDTSGAIIESAPYAVAPANQGVQVWERLVRPSHNIGLVICGHSGDPQTMSVSRTERNADGQDVHLMMFNPQAISGWNGNGGDGWLRLLEFQPDGQTVKARTYSPLFAASQTTEAFSWKHDAAHEFTLTLAPAP
ncbi:hypothetical protein HNR46_003038 [Haloferula luteola]|uniref:Calcineurin-like phosphoesterase domain-containing protein n=1 Tax=Haloferula luteola TaxID=595692 RepID=A0A840VG37_9BACT|nr:metallophosphoesterase [Haloferula luteola]MBB5352790.1 hypothetical protein [Haloferula luteola]